MRCVHFIGFRGEEYWSAVKVFGRPHMIHMGWDRRAQRDIGDDDLVVFAAGDENQPFAAYNYPDLKEADPACETELTNSQTSKPKSWRWSATCASGAAC